MWVVRILRRSLSRGGATTVSPACPYIPADTAAATDSASGVVGRPISPDRSPVVFASRPRLIASSTSTTIAAKSSGTPAPTRISWCSAAVTSLYVISVPVAEEIAAAYSAKDQATSLLCAPTAAAAPSTSRPHHRPVTRNRCHLQRHRHDLRPLRRHRRGCPDKINQIDDVTSVDVDVATGAVTRPQQQAARRQPGPRRDRERRLRAKPGITGSISGCGNTPDRRTGTRRGLTSAAPAWSWPCSESGGNSPATTTHVS
jgi:hypothetical protein